MGQAMTLSSGPVVLVTGCSSGIGLASAVALAGAGHQVIATVRGPGRGDRLRAAAGQAGAVLDVRQLDVTDEESVQRCVAGLIAEYGRLDSVLNNAGAGHVGTTEQDSLEDLRRVMEVNFFGVARVTRAATPHLRASRGRLVTVTSVGGVVGQPFNEAYCAAKFAVEGLMEGLAPVARRMGVRVSVVEPGAVASEFVANAGQVQERLAAAGPYRKLLQGYLERTRGAFAAAQAPEQVAAVVLGVLTAAEPAFRYQTSESASQFVGLKLADRTGATVQHLTGGWLG
jgi:NAD(P)-dependent dehydrogenase (short-subunit alcohol dehydrogenase family)